jgi:hypothetical protein
MNTEKNTVLQQAAEHRAREVLHHQINIDNYKRAIAIIDDRHSDSSDMLKFKEQLSGLLASSIVEQTKEQIMLEVITQQLSENE